MPTSSRRAQCTSGGRRAVASERKVRAFALRKEGKPLRAIAEELGVSHEMVRRYVRDGLEELNRSRLDDATELRTLEEARLDGLLQGLWAPATGGDEKAAAVALRVCESRRKLLGLDAPTKSEITGKDGSPVVGSEEPPPDLTRLSDDEIHQLQRLILKAKGLPEDMRPEDYPWKKPSR